MLEIRYQSPMPWHCFTASQMWGSRKHPGPCKARVWGLQLEGLAGVNRTTHLDPLDDDGIEELAFVTYSYPSTPWSAPCSFSRPEVLMPMQQFNPASTVEEQGTLGRLGKKKSCWTTHHSPWSPPPISRSDKISSIHPKQHPEVAISKRVAPLDDWALKQQPLQSRAPQAPCRLRRQPPHLAPSQPSLLYQSPLMEASERTIHKQAARRSSRHSQPMQRSYHACLSAYCFK